MKYANNACPTHTRGHFYTEGAQPFRHEARGLMFLVRKLRMGVKMLAPLGHFVVEFCNPVLDGHLNLSLFVCLGGQAANARAAL